MNSEFTMIPAQKKCPLCGGNFFHLVCICSDFDVIDISDISECFLLKSEESECNLSCYFECRRKNIVIDLVNDIDGVDSNLCCWSYDKRNSTDRLSVVRDLMKQGKSFNIRTNNKQLKSNHFCLNKKK